ncbi:TPA: hypothetical protein N5Y90_002448 [Vibrio cholerae]|uniref:Uncharacterized protein n=2 Tax=Vibrio cholerae TaxID=666 RepID=A0A395U9D4_VIBCL|nr:hypothetical protein [Vibrio cholerae]ASA40213.1 hypothetical protein [Vibrio cholerae O1 biovar El Tor]EGR1057266.1 hypothetical protein [Vibrio cholerae]EJB4830547.1 hypothetical protein [Vibrio cholerae]EJB5295498.1 hypothetical protein [Vibrio cholerae]ELJ8610531.1 hypothetical protein [Vibrio cholerae]
MTDLKSKKLIQIQNEIFALCKILMKQHYRSNKKTAAIVAMLGLNLTGSQVVEMMQEIEGEKVSLSSVHKARERYRPIVKMLQEETNRLYSLHGFI